MQPSAADSRSWIRAYRNAQRLFQQPVHGKGAAPALDHSICSILTRAWSLSLPNSIACAPRQVGWTATAPNSSVAFQVSGGQSGASFLLAMLCSYENVGKASVRFTSRDNGVEVAERVLEMRWNRSASQQCIHHVGRVGPGNHTLRVTALSSPADPRRGSNQVKLFGIYSQKTRSSNVLLEAPAAEEHLVAAEKKFKAAKAAFDAAVAARDRQTDRMDARTP